MEKIEYKKQELDDEEVFREYIDDLELSPEDFNKKILDIGAGDARFAKWAKDHHVNYEIYSLDPELFQKMRERTMAVRAKSEALPFSDNSFDLVVSNCSVPNVLEPNIEKINNSFQEALRVAKPGGEIRFGRVLKGEIEECQIKIRKIIDSILNELRAQPDKFEVEEKPHYPFEIYILKNGERELSARVYLIKIRKLK